MKQHKFSSRVEKANENDCGGCCFCTGRQRRCLWITGLTILLALAVLLSSLLINAAVSESPFVLQILDPQPVFLNDTLEEQRDRALLLGQAITFPTVSLNKTWTNETALQDLHLFLRQNYAPVFEADFIESTIVNEHSLLLRVEGEKVTGNPYLLCAHLDVVPAGPRDQWSYPPFHGNIIQEDGLSYVFGRGAIDDKQSVIGILEALKTLVEAGERPQRTFYVAFGHDEEVGGHKGAAQIAMVLKAVLIDRQEVLSFILDEGMFVMKGIFPGVDRPVAYVGVVEKGWTEVNLTVEGTQGHSSVPPKETAIGILAHAIVNLEDKKQPSRFGDSVEYDTMSYVAPFASFGYKLILANLWLFRSIVSKILSADAATDAIQRTTTAVTIIRGGVKNNVIPNMASALINHRVHAADTAQDVLDHDRNVIDDERVEITLQDSFRPTSVSAYHSQFPPFQVIANSIFQAIPDVILTPGTMVANTDTIHYQDLCSAIYRFQPVQLGRSDIHRFHGLDERISVVNFFQVVQFYYRLIHNADFDLEEQEMVENNDRFFEAQAEEVNATLYE